MFLCLRKNNKIKSTLKEGDSPGGGLRPLGGREMERRLKEKDGRTKEEDRREMHANKEALTLLFSFVPRSKPSPSPYRRLYPTTVPPPIPSHSAVMMTFDLI